MKNYDIDEKEIRKHIKKIYSASNGDDNDDYREILLRYYLAYIMANYFDETFEVKVNKSFEKFIDSFERFAFEW